MNEADTSLLLWLNYDGGAWIDAFWYDFTYRFTWIPAYIAILVVLVKHCGKDWKRLLWLVLSIALIITLADQISSGLLKHWVARPRPSHVEALEGLLHHVNDYRGGRYGFVSSHAANSIALCLWLVSLFKDKVLLWTLILWTAATCYSRLYLGVHYPGDIAGGLCVGVFAWWIVTTLSRRYLPNLHTDTIKVSPWPIILVFWATPLVIAIIPSFQ